MDFIQYYYRYRASDNSLLIYDLIEFIGIFNLIFWIVLYYTVDWIMDERWVWVRVYFHVANILLSESCVWLSILKFSSTDPFAAVNDSWSKTPEFYNFIGISYIISWLILVILHTTMNTLIHLIMIYHIHHKVSNQFNNLISLKLVKL